MVITNLILAYEIGPPGFYAIWFP